MLVILFLRLFVPMFSFYLFYALYVGIGNITALIGVAVGNSVFPLNPVKILVKFDDENGMDKIDECEANSSLRFQVFG
jgi:hypothetical protein